MTSFLRALPRLLDPDPEADPMEHTALTHDTHRVVQLHRKNEIEQHFFAPGVIQGPHDCQAHHEWEDSQRMAGEGWGRISLQIKALIVLVIVLAGIAVGAFLGTRLTKWLATVDLPAMAMLLGGKS